MSFPKEDLSASYIDSLEGNKAPSFQVQSASGPQRSKGESSASSCPPRTAAVSFITSYRTAATTKPRASLLLPKYEPADSRAAARSKGTECSRSDRYVMECLRGKMREELLRRLVKSKIGGNAISSQPNVQEALAKRLEEVMFKSSNNLEDYADIKTLDKRLQSLLNRMQQRKATKPGIQQTAEPARAAPISALKRTRTDNPQERRKRTVLLQLVGQAKMTRIFHIVAEIKLIQLGQDVTQGKPFNPIKKCSISGCAFMVPVPGSQKVPQVVRDLFFNTAIVPALEKTSPERFGTLPWDKLIDQGEMRLKAYHEWHKERRQTTTGVQVASGKSEES